MSLPKPPDSVITTLLARALLFLTHATQHSRLNSPLDRMVAIHGLDNSVEYLLRIVVQHLDIEAATGKTLDTVELASLAGEVNRYLKDTYNIELPYLTEIKLIRQVRNLVQHGIVDPQPDLPRYRKIVERFFDRTLLVIFGIAHGTLKVSSLVEDTEVRKFVEAAEEFIDQKKYLECVVAARDAFENARHKKTKQTALRINLLPALVESKVDRVNLHYFLTTIGAELELSGLGIDMQAFRRFEEYISHIPSEYRADKSVGNRVMQRPWNEHDARFCYDFASSAVLFWQSQDADRLYPVNLPDKHEWEVSIGDVVIPRGTEMGCGYFPENREEMESYFVSRELKDDLIALEPESSVLLVGKVYKNGVLERKYSYSIIVLACYARLATNNPERWEVILWWRRRSELVSEVFAELDSKANGADVTE